MKCEHQGQYAHTHTHTHTYIYIKMEFRTLELDIVSAEGLKNVNFFYAANVYAMVSRNTSPSAKLKTCTSCQRSDAEWQAPTYQMVSKQTH